MTGQNICDLAGRQAQFNQACRRVFDVDDFLLDTRQHDLGHAVYGDKRALQVLGVFMQFRHRIPVADHREVEREHIPKIVKHETFERIRRQRRLCIVDLRAKLRKLLVQLVIGACGRNGELYRHHAQTRG